MRETRAAASPDSPLLLAFLVTMADVAPHVPASWGLYCVTGEPMAGPRTLADIDAARVATGAQGPLVVYAWSGGCQRERELLRAGAKPAAVVALDGTSGDWPTLAEWHLWPWRAYAEDARRGAVLFVLTASEQVYTERLTRFEDRGPFASTLRVASALWHNLDATDARTLARGNMLPPGIETAGSLRVEIHDSRGDIDGGAHGRELHEHGPRILRELVAPHLASLAGVADTEPAPTPRNSGAPPPPDPMLRLRAMGPAVLELQRLLNAGGAPTVVDGDFGLFTERSVRAFQSARGLTSDGIVGPRTWSALRNQAFPLPPAPDFATGIDVSHYQGPPSHPRIEWPLVARAGHAFAICKLSQGSGFVDPHAARNLREARAAGLRVGVYHYLDRRVDALEQAAHFAAAYAPVRDPGDLRPWLDLEEGAGGGQGARALVWLRAVEAALGVRPGVYTSPAFAAETGLGAHLELAGYPLWVAHWGVDRPMRCPPWQADAWTVWQTEGDTGRCPGVVGACDLNRAKASLLG